MNEAIRAPKLRVVLDSGEQLGVLTPQEALAAARERNLDLVEIAPQADPPVCKIMDFGKYKYVQKKRAHEAKKHQHQVQLKEVKFRPKIEKHDYDFKVKKARDFFDEGNKVKVSIWFRGREITRKELALNIIERFAEDTKDLAELESRPNMEGRQMIAIFAPKKRPQKGKSKEGKEPEKKAPEGEKPSKPNAGEEAEEQAAAPAE